MRRTPPARMTAAEFEERWDDNGFELIDGVLTERFTGARTSAIHANIGYLISLATRSKKSGVTLDSSAPYHCFPGKPNDVRKPDVSFVLRERLASTGLPRGSLAISPDLSVEVVDPSEVLTELEDKVRDFLEAGTQLIWIVRPDRSCVQVRTADGQVRLLGPEDELTGNLIIPNLRVRVADLLPEEAIL